MLHRVFPAGDIGLSIGNYQILAAWSFVHFLQVCFKQGVHITSSKFSLNLKTSLIKMCIIPKAGVGNNIINFW